MHKKTTSIKNKKFPPEAYRLILEVLNATVKLISNRQLQPSAPYAENRATDEKGHEFHISGRELLAGFKIYMREEYGNLALLLLERWGITSTEDVGQIVFDMVEQGKMTRREADTIDDFKDVYDFSEVFSPDIMEL